MEMENCSSGRLLVVIVTNLGVIWEEIQKTSSRRYCCYVKCLNTLPKSTSNLIERISSVICFIPLNFCPKITSGYFTILSSNSCQISKIQSRQATAEDNRNPPRSCRNRNTNDNTKLRLIPNLNLQRK
ncbi:hypothetical protein CEXT_271611 [Caerostris extrusa]|uniref:Uncharacterized protein n=1 Tax=Caerostris extrusa TaxID=172846 RepID=A0AAV4MXK7_CAEEX|nr:hypothetical protein CEXT_271611 [Caerostris extrusa]